ncbi:twin-arginine translocation signal domain-containing protein, partial [Candidatus Poribacteria bacterium]|nr:twin-arginine translocation signal domain-containing protein [Candidatus Poribacteria bacterium]
MARELTRRQFLGVTAAAAAGCALPQIQSMGSDDTMNASKLPRWRGFNLLEKFTHWENKPFVESDFLMMKEWGFDFVRLPL